MRQITTKAVLVCLLPFFLLIMNISISAGETGKIRGLVLSKRTGEALPGVNVLVEGSFLGDATDKDGSFIILNIPPGNYTVTASFIGYQTVKQTGVEIRSDFTTDLQFELVEATVALDESVEIVAERALIRRDQTATVAEFSGEDIRALPVEDYSELLAQQAGVVQDENGLIHIRGGRASEVAYVVDGVPITDNYSGFPSVAIENNAVQELSLVSGTFNAEYGQALSGVVNIITREGKDKWEFSTEGYSGDYYTTDSDIFLDGESFNTTDVYNWQGSLGGPLPLGFRLFTSFRRFKSDGWINGRRDFQISDSTNLNAANPADWFIEQSGDGEIVPMNSFLRNTIQGKLTKRLGTGKLTYAAMWNDAEYQEYFHEFKYTPDGNYQQFQKGFNHSLQYTGSVGENAFYRIQYGFRSNEYRFNVFEDPLDPRYVDPDRLNIAAFRFFTGGTGPQHFRRETRAHTGIANFTWQVNKVHQLKVGIDGTLHRLFLREFSIQAARDGNGVEIFPFQPSVPATSAIGSNEYLRRPKEFSAYVQDKIELNSVVVNAGVRFDYFDANADLPLNPGNPQGSATEAAEIKTQWSPRLGIAYPLTATGILHFSFGRFFQMPPFQYLYTNPDFEVLPGALRTIMGNPNLKAQNTTQYELGLQQQFTNDLAVDFTVFVKDMRNLLGQEQFRLDNDVSSRYVRYTNRDYGQAKGFSIYLEKRLRDMWGININHTFQIVRGNASDPNALFFDLLANPPRESEKNVVYLDWDQRHTINGSLILGHPESWNVSIIGNFGSALPYTPAFQNQRTSFENSDRKPATLNFDLRADYRFRLAGVRFSAFAIIDNVFDKRNELTVFSDTGRSGYTLQNQFVGNTGLYPLSDFNNRPDYYSPPRRIVMGLKLN